MKDQDNAKFRANYIWFNQFFDGIKQIYEHIVFQLPVEFFHEGFLPNFENYYFPRYKSAPSIPPYYALMLEGRKFALQVVAVVDAELFNPSSSFSSEPSMITVVHTQAEKFSWLDEFALRVIKHQSAAIIETLNGVSWGKIRGKFPADFFAFQTQYDKFSDVKNPQAAVRKYIVDPVIVNLARGFQTG